ncbi:HMG box transcription factor BBX-like isoform X2 [Centruroides sculpturatus]|uniref:HMG box transcription factor BBX-like isoform X2 n=1 Tax=Centruroides sculpturatus TaxID=218467 RepID=UPI000C6E2CAC|nr:HMG box transcription factor BBX-like isoform X2 [Centruroides sculpturatus]
MYSFPSIPRSNRKRGRISNKTARANMAHDREVELEELDSEHDSSEPECGGSGVRRPMNAFFIFCKRHRDVVREKYPHLENRSITKILGEWWANLEQEEKATYTDLAKQYKEAFMKANPDFKWYKMPTPPARTLLTRPSNQRPSKLQLTSNENQEGSCGITPGKLADETQMGGLNSLITPNVSSSSSSSSSSTTSVSVNNVETVSLPKMDVSSISAIAKPPKKRYLINGAFPSNLESSVVTNKLTDPNTTSVCSALLELAEMCTNAEVQKRCGPQSTSKNCTFNVGISNIQGNDRSAKESPFTQSSSVRINAGKNTYSQIPVFNVNAANYVIDRAFSQSLNSASFSKSFLEHPISKSFEPLISKTSASTKLNEHPTEMQLSNQQEQPLNLCMEKEKTIKTSQQQLINHLVVKFMGGPGCSNIIDSTNDKSVQKYNHTSNNFQQELNKDEITSFNSYEINHNTDNMNNKNDTENFNHKDDVSSHWNNQMPDRDMVGSKYELTREDYKSNVTPPVKKLISSPPKKARALRCLISDNPESESHIMEVDSDKVTKESPSNSHTSSPVDSNGVFDVSPGQRKSQRLCKGKRYQALISEGLIQPVKERRTSKSSTSEDKQGSDTESVKDVDVRSPANRRNRKRNASDSSESVTSIKSDKDEPSKKSKGGLFDLDEQIAALPKCNMESFTKKMKQQVSGDNFAFHDDRFHSDTDPAKDPDFKPSAAIARRLRHQGKNTDSTSGTSKHNNSSSKRFKSGDFDLEEHIAALPKCDIEILNRPRRMKRRNSSSNNRQDKGSFYPLSYSPSSEGEKVQSDTEELVETDNEDKINNQTQVENDDSTELQESDKHFQHPQNSLVGSQKRKARKRIKIQHTII